MPFTLVAPIPLRETTTILPNPIFGDSEGTTSTMTRLRTVTGRRRTYVKTRDRRKLNWTFSLTRNKALELFEFYRSYNAHKIFIQDHNGRGWLGWMVNNPLEIEMSRRGAPPIQGWPTGETCQAVIEFEGARTDVDISQARILTSTAISEIGTGLDQGVFVDLDVPLFGSALQHNWDATTIVATDGDPLTTWLDSGPASNDLVATIGGAFDPTIDRSPTYKASSLVFNLRPTVSFESVSSALTTQKAAMHTTSNTSLFSNRRGTIFWVFAHTLQQFNTETEYGVWSLQNTTLDSKVEQVHISGSSSLFIPVSARFQPADVTNDIRLVTLNTNAIPVSQPFIYMVSRDTDTNLRFRTNGIERTGATILDNPGYSGLFHINDQKYTPQFNERVTGEWGQVMVYNKALNTTDIETVERYLSLRWGIPLLTVPF